MKSIRAKLTALMILICSVGMLMASAISITLSYNSLTEESLEKISQTTGKEAARINGWLENQTAYITSLAVELSYTEDFSKGNMLPRLNDHVNRNDQYFDVYMGYPDGTVTFASGNDPDYAAGWNAVKRPWYVGATADANKPFVTAPYTDTQTGSLCVTAAQAVRREGKVIGVAAADMLIDRLDDIVMQTTVGEESYAFLLDGNGRILIHPNKDFGPDANDNFPSLTLIDNGIYADILTNVRLDGDFARVRGGDGVMRYYTAQTIPATGWRLFTAIPVSVVEAPVRQMLWVSIALLVVVLALSVLLINMVIQQLVIRPIGKVTTAAEALTSGSTQINIDYDGGEDEIGTLVSSFTTMAKSIHEQAAATRIIADGNLAVVMPIRSDEDVMGLALEDLCRNLNEFIAAISQATVSVSEGSSQIADSSEALAKGALEQSRAIGNLSASIEQITENVRSSQEIIAQNHDVSNAIRTRAEQGSNRMQHMIKAVNEIAEASTSIVGVIKVIDEIASQTNILALNAAIEAAHAGEHGRGFAVVAEEVRALASDSSNAARKITSLIENSVSKTEEGLRIAGETNEALRVILGGVTETAELTERISRSAREQAEVIQRINEDIDLVAHVMNANTTSSENNLEVVSRLQDASQRLSEMVRRFNLDDNALEQPARRKLLNG